MAETRKPRVQDIHPEPGQAKPKEGEPNQPVVESGDQPGPQGPRPPRQPGGQPNLPTSGRKEESTPGGL